MKSEILINLRRYFPDCENIITPTEIKVKFTFRLVNIPGVGDFSFDEECIMESLKQEKILHLLDNYPAKLKHAENKFLLKECYYYAERLATLKIFTFLLLKKS